MCSLKSYIGHKLVRLCFWQFFGRPAIYSGGLFQQKHWLGLYLTFWLSYCHKPSSAIDLGAKPTAQLPQKQQGLTFGKKPRVSNIAVPKSNRGGTFAKCSAPTLSVDAGTAPPSDSHIFLKPHGRSQWPNRAVKIGP